MMAIDGVSAVGAVGKSLDIGATAATGPTSATAGTSFVDAVGKAFTDAIGSVQTGEAAAIQGLQGGMAPYKVVDFIDERAAHAPIDVGDPRQSGFRLSGNLADGDLSWFKSKREVEA